MNKNKPCPPPDWLPALNTLLLALTAVFMLSLVIVSLNRSNDTDKRLKAVERQLLELKKEAYGKPTVIHKHYSMNLPKAVEAKPKTVKAREEPIEENGLYDRHENVKKIMKIMGKHTQQ